MSLPFFHGKEVKVLPSAPCWLLLVQPLGVLCVSFSRSIQEVFLPPAPGRRGHNPGGLLSLLGCWGLENYTQFGCFLASLALSTSPRVVGKMTLSSSGLEHRFSPCLYWGYSKLPPTSSDLGRLPPSLRWLLLSMAHGDASTTKPRF